MGAADPALTRPQLGKIRAAAIDYDKRAEARMAVRIDEIPLLESERDLVVLLVNVKAVYAGGAVDGLAIKPDGVETDDGRRGQVHWRSIR